MDFQQYSKDIKLITNEFVKNAVKRTGSNMQISIPFQKVYEDACYMAGKTIDESSPNHLEIKHHVRDNLLGNNLIFMDPQGEDNIFITQKAIDEFNKISEKNNKI